MPPLPPAERFRLSALTILIACVIWAWPEFGVSGVGAGWAFLDPGLRRDDGGVGLRWRGDVGRCEGDRTVGVGWGLEVRRCEGAMLRALWVE
jgi:hypothetical protein